MKTRCYLLRHGKTNENLENRFAGRSNACLHKEGREQIESLAVDCRKYTFNRIIAGPLARTVETAEILTDILAVPLEIDERFTEINLPHWDGLTKMEITGQYGDEYPTWLESPHLFFVKGCETIGDVQKRALAGIDAIRRKYQGETVLVVSHLIVIRSLLLHDRNLPVSAFRSIEVPNGTLCRLQS